METVIQVDMPEENDNDNIVDENEEQNFTVENPSLDLEVNCRPCEAERGI